LDNQRQNPTGSRRAANNSPARRSEYVSGTPPKTREEASQTMRQTNRRGIARMKYALIMLWLGSWAWGQTLTVGSSSGIVTISSAERPETFVINGCPRDGQLITVWSGPMFNKPLTMREVLEFAGCSLWTEHDWLNRTTFPDFPLWRREVPKLEPSLPRRKNSSKP
jgi:hypothetical protein